MRTLFDCIGDRFEEILQTEFPDFRKTRNKDGTTPDFFNGTFWLEAKVGFQDYGAQIKMHQVRNFNPPNDKPVIYALGYHNLAKTKEILKGLSPEETDQILTEKMGINLAYLVSNSIMRALWNREHHTSQQNKDWHYFSIKPRHFDAIIENLPFSRKGIRHMPSRFYRLQRPKLLLQPAPRLNGRTSNLEFGLVLDRESDKTVIDYLSERGLTQT